MASRASSPSTMWRCWSHYLSEMAALHTSFPALPSSSLFLFLSLMRKARPDLLHSILFLVTSVSLEEKWDSINLAHARRVSDYLDWVSPQFHPSHGFDTSRETSRSLLPPPLLLPQSLWQRFRQQSPLVLIPVSGSACPEKTKWWMLPS